jgi:hypothetical protein
MVWRIHFTAEDLERIQVRPTLGPLAETVKAMSLLRCPQQPRTAYRQWRGQVKGKLTPQMAAFTALIPPGSKGVDLPMLTGAAATLEQGVQALLAVPREHLLVEIEFTDRSYKLAASVWEAAETGGQARRQLAAAAVAAHQVLVEPYWTRIHACLQAEHVARLRTLAEGGPDRLLASLQSPWVRWRPPVLEVLVPADYDVPLNGRGIALVPSVFVGQIPSLHENPNDPASAPWLVVPPADGRLEQRHLWGNPRPRGAALAALVGRNHGARGPGGHLARGGQPARVGAAGRGADRHAPAGQRGAARAHAARRRVAGGRLAPGGGLVMVGRTMTSSDHRLWFPTS